MVLMTIGGDDRLKFQGGNTWFINDNGQIIKEWRGSGNQSVRRKFFAHVCDPDYDFNQNIVVLFKDKVN